MKSFPKTKGLDGRLCFISYRAYLNSEYGEDLGIRVLLSEMIKSKKQSILRKERKKALN